MRGNAPRRRCRRKEARAYSSVNAGGWCAPLREPERGTSLAELSRLPLVREGADRIVEAAGALGDPLSFESTVRRLARWMSRQHQLYPERGDEPAICLACLPVP